MGVHLRADGAAVARFRAAAEPQLSPVAFVEGVDLDTPGPLRSRVEQWGLAGARVSFVLGPKDYQLLLVESPAVEEAELAGALRWRIKDLVAYDIDEAVIDYISLPDDAYRGRSRMLYVAVMPRSLSARIAAFVEGAGLTLDCIDIPELALLNLLRLQPPEATGLALLALQPETSPVDLVADGALYLTRSAETGAGLLEAGPDAIESAAAGMILDIQRSLDYYESQIGKPPCLKLLLCPLQAGETPLLSQFRYNLPVEIAQLDLGEWLSSAEPLTPDLQAQCLLAVAGAMREAGGR